jgi:Ca-activated chloride channel family protein
MAVIVVLAGSWYGYRQLSDKGCTGQVKLSVAAATEIAPAVEQVAQQWITDGANVNGTCVAVNVYGINPATMASAVAREHKVTLTGLGPAPASVAVPDVWIPDSSTWLLRLKSEATGFVPTDGTPVAESPVVLAMPQPLAQQAFGWPDKKIGWKQLLDTMTKTQLVRTGIVDPNRDAAGLAGLLALSSVAGTDAKGQQKAVGALRALAAGSSSIRENLLQSFPRARDANAIATSLGAAPLSEEDVIAFNAEKPPVELAALYLEPTPPALDYPYAVMPEVDLQKSAAATGLRQQLQKPAFKNALAAAGLRGPDGTAGSGFATPIGAPPASAPATAPSAGANGGANGGTAAAGLDASAISQTLGRWAAVTVPGRVLAVFDVSGSMLTKVPTAGGLTRAEVMQQASAKGLALFDDQWAVGLWVFSTNMVGKRPWKEIAPIAPLSAARSQLQQATGAITPKVNGDTGLYDTALAAYKEVQNGWQPGRVNSVIMFTDGKNENKDGITRDQLVTQLKKLKDPKRPVRMVIIGVGNEVDRKELEAITSATDAGGVFIAPDPAKIGDIFLEAIASRSGAR